MNIYEEMIPYLLHWYKYNARVLPWREDPSAYHVWVSEIMLQQTRVEAVRGYYMRFLDALPTVKALAECPDDRLMKLWEGLGYYSRARNLHAAARQIVAMGAFPDTLEGIRSLRGVGDYTAAAIGSICFGIPAAVVDGNVYRVLARYFGITTPVGTSEAKKEFTLLAQRLLPEKEASAFNQGMMDFGALQCAPKNPDCLSCPLQSSCKAFQMGRTAFLPVKKPAVKPLERHLVYIYVRFDGETAIRRRGAGDIWQGLYEPLVSGSSLPPCHSERNEASPVLLKSGVKHQLTHRTLLADFYLWEPSRRPALPEGYIWIKETELDRFGKPRLFELLLEAVNP